MAPMPVSSAPMNFIKCILFLLLTGIQLPLFAQQTLWANKVLGYSSEYRPEPYGFAYRSKQILGEPNKLPVFGNSPCAWTPAEPESKNEEWIKVGFEKEVNLKQIAIAESFNPGSIARVYAYSPEGKEYLIYQNKPGNVGVSGRMLHILPEQKDLQVNAVKLVLQPDQVAGFNQIDAVAISDQSTPIEASIKLAPDISNKLVRENLGKNINSIGNELAPIISSDGKTLYFTRANHPDNIGSPRHQDVWYSTQNSRNQWSSAVNMGPPINNAGDNAIMSISSDGKKLYLINHYAPDGNMSFGLSESFYTKNGWTFPKAIKMPGLNDQKEMDIAVSPHGNVMLLSLKGKDSEGDQDLFVSFLQSDNSWSEPINMGKTLNTADYEGTPFLALDNRTLYFSSSGRSGYGSSDIYITRRLDDTWLHWSEPLNLGPVFNSSKWDCYFTVPASGEYSYISSSDNSMGEQDIFKVSLPPELKPDPTFLVTGTVLSGATNKPMIGEILVQGKTKNEVVSKLNYDPATGDFRIILPAKEIYKLTASSDGYFPSIEEIDFVQENNSPTIRKNLVLQPIAKGQPIRLSNTMFQQSSAEVVPSSFEELDRIVSSMTEHPNMEILLEGHTDNQGDVAKNVKLSEERVLEVKKYLTSKGIDGRRIQTKAWGPAKPIASNATEQSRQKNRRVEFTILKM